MENKTEFILRDSTKEDMKSVFELIKELADFEKGLHEVTNTVENLEKDGFGENPCFKCIVAESNHKIIGFALYFSHYSTWKGNCLFLDDLYVKQEYRSQGVGKALFEKIIKISKETHAKKMMWQVLDWNESAIKFYKKFGADIATDWYGCKLNYEQLQNFNFEK